MKRPESGKPDEMMEKHAPQSGPEAGSLPDDRQQQLEELERLNRKTSPGPLRTPGFNSRLQRRIEQEIDRRSKRRRNLKPMLLIGSATAVLAAVLVIPWDAFYAQRATLAALENKSYMSSAAMEAPAPPSITSALLIGLRTEHEDKNASRKLSSTRYSTYRTMLIAPVRGQLQKTSEGSGILMPYKQDFWKIDALTSRTATDEYHYLSAHLAGQPAPVQSFHDDPSEELHHVETLVFAGNQYLSVAESDAAAPAAGSPSGTDRIWVRTLPQLAQQAPAASGPPVTAASAHVSLTDVFGPSSIGGVLDELNGKRQRSASSSEITGDNWTIARSPGRWDAKVAETVLPADLGTSRYTLHDVPRELPDQVVAYDELVYPWEDIKATWPNATDALSSPMNDMIAVFQNGRLDIYPYGQAPDGAPLLSVPLKPGEQLVMAQWATDHYVQSWIDRAAQYLRPAQ